MVHPRMRRGIARTAVVSAQCAAAIIGASLLAAGAVSARTAGCVSWKRVPTPAAGDWWHNLSAVAARSENDAWAVGWYTSQPNTLTFAQHWDGRKWVATPIPNPTEPATWTLARNQLRDVAVVGRTEVWAVGDHLSDVTKHNEPFAVHWDGRAWRLVPLPRLPSGGYLYGVDGVSPRDVWAVGSIVVSGTVKAMILHWDGSSWTVVRHPASSPGSRLRAVDARRPNDVWAVGVSGRKEPLVEHWDGRRWRVVRVAAYGAGANLFAVTALGPRRVWAVGQYYRKGEIDPRALAILWNGRTWRFTRPPNRRWFDNTLVAVDAEAAGGVWAAAEIVSASNAVDSVMYRWDGRRWRRRGMPTLRRGAISDIDVIGPGSGWAVGWERDYATVRRLGRC